MRGSGFLRASVSTALVKFFHEQRRRIEPDVKYQWAMFEVQWELSFLMFEVQWELSFLKRSKMTSQLCTLYVRLCTLYVRVEFPGIPGHASYAGLPVQYHYAFSWIVGFFV